MVRLLIEDVTLTKATRSLGVRLRGGATRQLTWVPDPHTSEVYRTSDEVVAEIDRLLNDHTDGEVAKILDERGYRSAYGVPWKGTVPQRVRIPPGKLSLQPVAIGADGRGNDIVRSTSMERAALGGPATMRAATRVNAEQASKLGMREPTRP